MNPLFCPPVLLPDVLPTEEDEDIVVSVPAIVLFPGEPDIEGGRGLVVDVLGVTRDGFAGLFCAILDLTGAGENPAALSCSENSSCDGGSSSSEEEWPSSGGGGGSALECG